MKLSKNHLYWLLQILGWGIPFMLNALGKLFIGNFSLSTSYVLFENGILMGSGIIASHLFRYLYKYQIKWQDWSWIKFLWTAVALIFCACLITVSVEILCPIAYQLFENKALERSLTNYALTYINAVVYLIFWLILYLLINYTFRHQQLKVERLKLENIAKESQLNTLKGQINPHFMFNSLNNIRGLMLEDVDKARDMVTQLSEMLRFSLARKDNDRVSLQEEIAVVRNYIALSKIQLEERLEYEEYIAEGVLNLEVPPMLIQMLVENAIKHGVAELPKGGKVILQVTKESNQLIIQVINDGSLGSTIIGTQIGVLNIQQRLELLYNHKSSFELFEKEETVVAQVIIPIR